MVGFGVVGFELWLGLALFFLTGLLARYTDAFEKNKRYVHFTLISAVAYGFGGGVLAAASPAFAAVVFGIVLGVVFGGKVDSRQHHVAVAVLFLTALLLNTAPLFIPLAILCAASFLDEDLHESISCEFKRSKIAARRLARGRVRGGARDGKRAFSPIKALLGSRVLVELAALVLGLFTGAWVFLACVLAFDAGCYFAPKLGKWFPEH